MLCGHDVFQCPPWTHWIHLQCLVVILFSLLLVSLSCVVQKQTSGYHMIYCCSMVNATLLFISKKQHLLLVEKRSLLVCIALNFTCKTARQAKTQQVWEWMWDWPLISKCLLLPLHCTVRFNPNSRVEEMDLVAVSAKTWLEGRDKVFHQSLIFLGDASVS